mmetsp:Transcript_77112/g.249603  ORF Transcript_77112/g.249603 Transcript_77112/m.249603 type:complete len:187 (+) Transcript_77112:660-1220(+)
MAFGVPCSASCSFVVVMSSTKTHVETWFCSMSERIGDDSEINFVDLLPLTHAKCSKFGPASVDKKAANTCESTAYPPQTYHEAKPRRKARSDSQFICLQPASPLHNGWVFVKMHGTETHCLDACMLVLLLDASLDIARCPAWILIVLITVMSCGRFGFGHMIAFEVLLCTVDVGGIVSGLQATAGV